MKILVTGSAGFIGFHLTKELLSQGFEVVGLDNLNNYYDVRLKLDRLSEAGIPERKVAYNEKVQSSKFSNYHFIQLNLEDIANIERLFLREGFNKVCHLAGQAGVRYSIKNPHAYMQSNVVGTFNILEAARHNKVEHLVYASSSSVYGANTDIPYSEEDNVDKPISFYAATKKTNELMAYTYSHLYKLPTTGIRFFTVYGPWGRPDMAYSIFTKAILKGEPIKVFNNGKLYRDFTYVDDIVNGVYRILKEEKFKSRDTPYSIYNIGNNKPVNLLDFIITIEQVLGIEAKKEFLPMQAGDVETTFANVDKLVKDYAYLPNTSLKEGIERFVSWYARYYPQEFQNT